MDHDYEMDTTGTTSASSDRTTPDSSEMSDSPGPLESGIAVDDSGREESPEGMTMTGAIPIPGESRL